MKIVFKTKNLNKLAEIKDVIDEILNINFEELELTEENIKKAISIQEKIKDIKKLYWDFEGVDIKIISSEGTELTKIN